MTVAICLLISFVAAAIALWLFIRERSASLTHNTHPCRRGCMHAPQRECLTGCMHEARRAQLREWR